MNLRTTARTTNAGGPRRAGALRCGAAILAALAGVALADDAKTSGDPAPSGRTETRAAPKSEKSVPAANAATQSGARSAPRSLDEALRILSRRRTDVAFTDLALAEVVDFIARVGRVNAIVGPALVVKAAGPLPTVTLKLRDVNLRQLAEMVAKSTGTALVVKDGVLQFTTPEDARGTPVLRVVSIADLTFRIRNFPGPDIRLHTGDTPKIVQEEETDQEHAFDDPQVIVDLIRKFTGEGTWDDEGVSITADQNKLVVKQYPKVLREIARFLALLRAAK